MADLKTQPTASDVGAFLDSISPDGRRDDCRALTAILERATGASPKMWGSSIVGFGDYHYKYASGREGDTFVAGFSPRRQDLTLYFTTPLEAHADLIARLGKARIGKGCVHVKRLEDIDEAALVELVTRAVAHAEERQ